MPNSNDIYKVNGIVVKNFSMKGKPEKGDVEWGNLPNLGLYGYTSTPIYSTSRKVSISISDKKYTIFDISHYGFIQVFGKYSFYSLIAEGMNVKLQIVDENDNVKNEIELNAGGFTLGSDKATSISLWSYVKPGYKVIFNKDNVSSIGFGFEMFYRLHNASLSDADIIENFPKQFCGENINKIEIAEIDSSGNMKRIERTNDEKIQHSSVETYYGKPDENVNVYTFKENGFAEIHYLTTQGFTFGGSTSMSVYDENDNEVAHSKMKYVYIEIGGVYKVEPKSIILATEVKPGYYIKVNNESDTTYNRYLYVFSYPSYEVNNYE